jgi:hypothetical protein
MLYPHTALSTRAPRTDVTQRRGAPIDDQASPGTGKRDRWFRVYPIALGLGGLSGAWRAATHLGAPAWPAVTLAVLCLGAWLTITVMYVLGGF